MAKITSSGPNLLPKLKELVDLTRDIRIDGSTTELEKIERNILKAIKEITDR